MDDFCAIIRSLITPYQNGVLVSKLCDDYKDMEGEDVPYQALGYSTPVELINAIPLVTTRKRQDGNWWAICASSEKTAHIHELVSKQKKSKKKPRSYNQSRRSPPNYSNGSQSRGNNSYNKPRVQRSNSDYYPSQTQSGYKNQPRSSQPNYNRQRSYDKSSTQQSSRNNVRLSSSFQSKSQTTPTSLLSRPPKKVTVYLPQGSTESKTTDSAKSDTSSTKIDVVFRQPEIPQVKQQQQQRTCVNENIPHSVKEDNYAANGNKEKSRKSSPTIPTAKSFSRAVPTINSYREQSTSLSKTSSPPPGSVSTPPIPSVAPVKSLFRISKLSQKLNNTKIQDRLSIIPTIIDKPEKSIVINDPRKKLEELAKQMNLPKPIYQNSRSGKPPCEYSAIRLGSKYRFVSYPFEAKTIDEAEIHAAEKALEQLCEIANNKPIQLSVTNDRKLIAERILKIVNDHRNGVIESKMSNYYEQEHNESLPNDWTKVFEDLAEFIELDICMAGRLITKKNLSRTAPQTLILPEDNLWSVHITEIIDTKQVWGRLTSDEYKISLEKLSDDMNQHYLQIIEAAKTVEKFRYYAIESEGNWYRVQVEEVDEKEDIVVIFFIDFGDRDIVSRSLLYPLENRFYKVPAQAIKMCISRLEDFSECKKINEIADSLLNDKSLYVEVLNREIDSAGVNVIKSVFWDTSNDDDINLNEELLKQINNFCQQSSWQESQDFQVLLTHIDNNGNIYLQPVNEKHMIFKIEFDKLKCGLNDSSLIQRAQINNNVIDETQVFIVQDKNDNWVRVKVIQSMGFDHIKVFTIDYGYTFEVDKSKLLRLEFLSNFLAKYPPQATMVTLNEINKLTPSMIERLKILVPKEETLSCKVIQSGDVPTVVLIKRMPDNILVSINLNLEQPQNENNSNNLKNKSKKRYDLSANKKLRAPIIPKRGETFDAYVTNLCANPDNFVVQLRKNMEELRMMMDKLKVVADSYDGSSLSMENIKEGQLYTAKHDNGLWYRVCLNHILDDETLIVYYCDYGNISVVTINELQPLNSQFFELPYQALRAKLVGIKPKNGDWDLETCLRFRDLVVDKDFYAVVEDIETDIIRRDEILGIKLFEKSEKKTVISNILIQQDIAVPIIS